MKNYYIRWIRALNTISRQNQRGIIQKKSAFGSWTLPLVTFDKKVPFFRKTVLFKVFQGKTTPKVSDSGCCPKIVDFALTKAILKFRECIHQNLENGHRGIFIWKYKLGVILEKNLLKKLYLKVIKLGTYMKQQNF